MTDLAGVAAAITEARMRVQSAYAEAIGRHRSEVITPALLLDIAAARRNVDRMADRMRELPASLRPHIKVHKSPELAQLQIDAGAIGVSTATVWEAAVMASSGVRSVLIANMVVGADKIAAVAALARNAEIIVAIDDVGNAAELAAAASRAGTSLGVVIELDTGMDRAGVDSIDEVLALADRVATFDGLRLLGLTGYEGHCSLTPDKALRHERQRAAMKFLVDAANALRVAGHPSPLISAGGTATWDWTGAYEGVTESQAGSYVLMDAFHGDLVSDFEPALTVAATVISRPRDRLILDVGSKSMGAPALATIVGSDLPNLRFDEEHGVFDATAGTELAPGDPVELYPGYAPATVNLYDAYLVVEDDQIVDVWPIIPRGPGHGGFVR
jgi:D-serine deaminase-like pyridoxal phosphate-dependent protein